MSKTIPYPQVGDRWVHIRDWSSQPVTVMAVAHGYAMVRYPRCTPFVESVKTLQIKYTKQEPPMPDIPRAEIEKLVEKWERESSSAERSKTTASANRAWDRALRYDQRIEDIDQFIDHLRALLEATDE